MKKQIFVVVCLSLALLGTLFYAAATTTQPHYIVLTFDDGKMQASADQTVSIMDSFGYKGVAMAVVDWTGPSNPVWAHMLQKGWEIGCHTWTHATLTQLSASQLVHEVSDAKAWLEQAFNTTIISFGYPGSSGSDSPTVLDALKNAGYLYARESTWHYYWDGQRSLQVVSWFADAAGYTSQIQSAINDANKYGVAVASFHGVYPNNDPASWGTLTPAQFQYCLTQIRNAGLTVVTFKEWDQIKYGTPIPPTPAPPTPTPTPPSPTIQIVVTVTMQPFNMNMQLELANGTAWTAPATITVWQRTWTFQKWSDGSTNQTRTFTVNATVEADYG